jgi:hypothetical protein
MPDTPEDAMNQTEKAKRFAELHVKGAPLLLYNAWDAGSAKSILAAGAQAVATSSWSVAEAQGYRDGEAIPIGLAERIVGRIAATIEAPVTVDFKGGYSEDDGELAENVSRLLDTGVIGLNLEDRVVKGSGLYSVERQARRIAAVRKAAEQKAIDLHQRPHGCVFRARKGRSAGHRRSSRQSQGVCGCWRVGLLYPRLGGRCADRPDLRGRAAARKRHGHGRRTIECPALSNSASRASVTVRLRTSAR